MSAKPKIAFFDFTSCEGCQLTIVDLLQTHLGLLDLVEIVQFREAISDQGEDYAVAFIEGSCTRPSDEARLRKIREQAAMVVALGTCAHLGGVNAMKNRWAIENVQKYVYGANGKDTYESYAARPISAVIKVDAAIPGCPIDRYEFLRVVQQVLQGRVPKLPDYPLCVECKFKENGCLNKLGYPCLGPVTRAGCNAICPTYRRWLRRLPRMGTRSQLRVDARDSARARPERHQYRRALYHVQPLPAARDGRKSTVEHE